MTMTIAVTIAVRVRVNGLREVEGTGRCVASHSRTQYLYGEYSP